MLRLLRYKFQKLRLGNKGDKAEARLQAMKVSQGKGSLRCLNGQGSDFSMWKLEQTIGQADIVQNLQHRGVNGVATKVALEVLVFFQQHDRNAFARQ